MEAGEAVGIAGDTTKGEAGEATYLVIMKCLGMAGGAVRTAEEAMGVVVVEGWAVTMMGREAFPPVEVELGVDVVVAVLWKLSSAPEACQAPVLARREVSRWRLSRNASYCGVAEPLLKLFPSLTPPGRNYSPSSPEQNCVAFH
jgi:hypothetical protein